MRWVHSPQGTPLSYLPARFRWAPHRTCLFSGTKVWEIAWRTNPSSTSPARSCSLWAVGTTDSCLLLIEI